MAMATFIASMATSRSSSAGEADSELRVVARPTRTSATTLSSLSASPAELERDVAIEAMNVAMAIADADGRHGHAELGALAEAFGGRFGAAATVGLDGRRDWLEHPSTLFEILVGHDARDGTRTAWRYYELAMRIAHTTAGLDAVTSEGELAAIDRLRSTLLGAMKAGPPSPSEVTASSPAVVWAMRMASS